MSHHPYTASEEDWLRQGPWHWHAAHVHGCPPDVITAGPAQATRDDALRVARSLLNQPRAGSAPAVAVCRVAWVPPAGDPAALDARRLIADLETASV